MMKFWLFLVILTIIGMSFGTETMHEFDVNNESWASYANKLEMYFKTRNITEDLKLPTMILVMGKDAYELLLNLVVPDDLTELTYKQAKALLKQHLRPTTLNLEGRYQFRSRHQNNGEDIHRYVKDLLKLARVSNFGNTLGVNLRDQFIFGLENSMIKQQLLAENYRLTFSEAVNIALNAGELDSDKNEESWNEKLQVCPGPNEVTPFTCQIPRGVHPGRIIRVRGSTRSDVHRFSIDLVCGPDKTLTEEDVAFHIDFRFFLNETVRNSMNASLPTHIARWTYWTEEKNKGVPIPKGQSFEVLILCLEKNFAIYINEKHYTDFHHNIPVHRITNFLMEGDVSVQSVSYEDICSSKSDVCTNNQLSNIVEMEEGNN